MYIWVIAEVFLFGQIYQPWLASDTRDTRGPGQTDQDNVHGPCPDAIRTSPGDGPSPSEVLIATTII